MKNRMNFTMQAVLGTAIIFVTLPSMYQPVNAQDATTVKTQFAEIDGRKIAYRSIGKGTPIILANRFRGNLDVWDPTFLNSLAKNYRVITFDYSGFGLSTGEPATEMLKFADDVKDLAEALKFRKIIVGGWSFGGFVAQIVMTEYPELISQCILIGTTPPGINAKPVEQLFIDTAYKPNYTPDDETILFFEPASEESRKAAKLSFDRIAKRNKDLSVPIPEKLWGNFNKGIEDFVADKSNAREKLLKTKIPILVISGDHDLSCPVENWYALNRKLLSTQILVIPQSGHGPHHQYPEMIARYITDFIQKTSS